MASQSAHVGQALRSLAITRSSSQATVFQGRVKTGAQLFERVAALAAGLRKLGLQCGDRVCIAALNSDLYLEWLLAVPCAGGIVTPLNYRWSINEAIEAVQQINPTFLVIDQLCAKWCTELKSRFPKLLLVAMEPDLNEVHSFIHAEFIINLGGGKEFQLFWAPNSIALICFTSGTTGRPKGVAISHNAMVIQSLAKIAMVHYSSNDVYLHLTPLCHIGGICSAYSILMAGGCHVFLPKFQACSVFGAIEEHRVTSMITVPAMMNDLVLFTASKGEDQRQLKECFPSVTKILNGAGSLSLNLLESARKIFSNAQFSSAYGMTEACSSMTFLVLHDPKINLNYSENCKRSGPLKSKVTNDLHHLGGFCVGKPAPHIELIVKTSRSTFKSSRVLSEGNVLVRGPHLMHGYWGQPEDLAFDEDGWFDTGDIGWMDEDGQLWLLGRKKDVVKSGGENVYSFEVENILSRHPAVLAVAVVGIPDARLNEAVAAMVLLREGWRWVNDGIAEQTSTVCFETAESAIEAGVVSPSSLRSHCIQQGLSRYKLPRVLVRRASPFPVTSTGKVRKDLVKQELSVNLVNQSADDRQSRL